MFKTLSAWKKEEKCELRRLCASRVAPWKAKVFFLVYNRKFLSISPWTLNSLSFSRERGASNESECGEGGGGKQVACAERVAGRIFFRKNSLFFSSSGAARFVLVNDVRLCSEKNSLFSPTPPNAMLHNTNESLSLAPLTIPLSLSRSTSHCREALSFFILNFPLFLHAQQQWKSCFALILHANSTRSPSSTFRFRGASSTAASPSSSITGKTASLTPVRNHLRMSFNLN